MEAIFTIQIVQWQEEMQAIFILLENGSKAENQALGDLQ